MDLFDNDYFEDLTAAGFLREMQRDTSLSYHLHRLTKAELTEIRKQLELKGVSNLPKSELIDALLTAIPQALPAQLRLLDELTYDDLKILVQKKGLLKNPTDISIGMMTALRNSGVAFAGLLNKSMLTLIMPREILQSCRRLLADSDLRQTVIANQRILLACRGLATFYGIVPLADLRCMLADMDLIVNRDHLVSLLNTTGKNNGYFDLVADLICDKRVVYVEEIITQHLVREHYGYYRVSLESALRASQQMYIDWDEAHRILFEYFMDEHSLAESAAAEELMFIVFAFNNELPIPNLLMRLAERQVKLQDFPETIELLTLLDAAYQETRLWRYRGYTPSEMRALESRPHLRVLPPLPSESASNDEQVRLCRNSDPLQ